VRQSCAATGSQLRTCGNETEGSPNFKSLLDTCPAPSITRPPCLRSKGATTPCRFLHYLDDCIDLRFKRRGRATVATSTAGVIPSAQSIGQQQPRGLARDVPHRMEPDREVLEAPCVSSREGQQEGAGAGLHLTTYNT
jgi:hypothetical protein